MKSEHTVTVIVTDQNDSPSTPRSVHVIVHSFNGKTPLGKIADVHPNDPDITGIYSCKILQGSNSRVLSIPTACDLHTNKITSGMSIHLSLIDRYYLHDKTIIIINSRKQTTCKYVFSNINHVHV
jgi:protocadherin Fat 4